MYNFGILVLKTARIVAYAAGAKEIFGRVSGLYGRAAGIAAVGGAIVGVSVLEEGAAYVTDLAVTKWNEPVKEQEAA